MFDIYVSKDTQKIPDQTNYDAVIKKETSVQLTEKSFKTCDGFVFAIYTKLAPNSLPANTTIESQF